MAASSRKGIEVATAQEGRQLHQIFTEERLGAMRQLFCRQILTNLKFRHAPRCAARLISKAEELARGGVSDAKAYATLHTLVHEELFTSKEYLDGIGEGFSREQNRVDQVAPILKGFLDTPTDGRRIAADVGGGARADRRQVVSYLDVGCNEGSITGAVGRLLGAERVCGCDVVAPSASSAAARDFEFTLLDAADPYRLPYADASQDVVTAFMSLHHIEHIDRTLSEIHRVLRDDGLFLIREHDCTPPELALLLDLMHAFYAMVWPATPEMSDFATLYSCYRPRSDLLALLQHSTAPLFETVYSTPAVGAWRHYYEVFVKSRTRRLQPDLVAAWFPADTRKPAREQPAEPDSYKREWGLQRSFAPPRERARSPPRYDRWSSHPREPLSHDRWPSRPHEPLPHDRWPSRPHEQPGRDRWQDRPREPLPHDRWQDRRGELDLPVERRDRWQNGSVERSTEPSGRDRWQNDRTERSPEQSGRSYKRQRSRSRSRSPSQDRRGSPRTRSRSPRRRHPSPPEIAEAPPARSRGAADDDLRHLLSRKSHAPEDA